MTDHNTAVRVSRPRSAKAETTSRKPRSARTIWRVLERELRFVARQTPGCWLELAPRDPSDDLWTWSATAWEQPPTYRDCAIVLSGCALAELAALLPLERTPAEVPSAFITQDGALVVDIIDLSVAANVVRMGSHHDVRRFIEARERSRTPPAWDTARTRRLTRLDGQGWRHVLEPGVNWFVEWLEAEGATTTFSCEGHPNGFYIVFSANRRLARSIAVDGVLDILPIRLRSVDLPAGDQAGPDGIGLWTAELTRIARDYDDLDAMLHVVAFEWTVERALRRSFPGSVGGQ